MTGFAIQRPPGEVPSEGATAEIVFEDTGVTATCTGTDTVLQIARASGVPLPAGCTFGICGACKLRKAAGEVHMVHNGGISDEDVDDGFILACCSNPIGRVRVEVSRGHIAFRCTHTVDQGRRAYWLSL